MPNDKDDQEKVNRTYHKPVSIKVEKVSRIHVVRELPQETWMTANIYLSLKAQEQLLFMISENLARKDPDGTLSLTIEGIS